MSCKDFKAIVNELVYDKVVSAETRQTGFAHAAMCANCALLLSETQDVRSALQMTIAAEAEEAPARVKEFLLAAFANQTKATASPATVVSISSHRRIGWLSVAAIAAAAVLLIALLPPVLLRRSAPAPNHGRNDLNAGNATPLSNPKAITAEPGSTPVTQSTNGPQPPRHIKDYRLTARASRNAPREEKANTALAAATSKTTNEFLPLTYLASSTAMESGTVVRVKLSRASLISLGLSISSESSDELIKADLIMGDDGVARAIRLVE